MKPKNKTILQKIQRSFPHEIAFLSEKSLVSTDFFWVTFVLLALGIAGLLVVQARSVEHLARLSYAEDASSSPSALEQRVKSMARGFPLERMAPLIAAQDQETAAFLVGIAKKESNWGKRVPRQEDGRDCFNYWGYRGVGKHMTPEGYTCFRSREQAVRTIGRRIDTLRREHGLKTARDMVVWKCGWSCAEHSTVGVEKWIQDVEYYYQKVRFDEGDAS